LKDAKPAVSNDRTYYSLVIEIYSSEPERSAVESLARAGMIIEVFSADKLREDLVGRTIAATLALTGATDGVRWWISNVRVMS
jgi:hypothetical protein